jgi:sugar lactone lactonase YvrE
MLSMQAVPTTVVTGPDGALYVGQLTGFPFPVGGARVYRVPSRGGTPAVFASGFTNIIDIAFGRDGSLYVLEMFANGLLSNDPAGALIRVAPDGTQTTVASTGLTLPGGVGIDDNDAIYVTNFATSAGGGQVVRINP